MTRPCYSEDVPLLAAILADPFDDTVRLAFADYCDETGRPERAAFIRAQIELHDQRAVWEVPHGVLREFVHRGPGDNFTALFLSGSQPSLSPYDYLRFENEPFNCGRMIGAVRIEKDWTEIEFGTRVELPPNTIDACRHRDLRELASRHYRKYYSLWFGAEDGTDPLGLKLQPSWVDGRVTRGFLSRVNSTVNAFVAKDVARDLFRSHPITSVKLVDREPWEDIIESENRFTWRVWNRWGESPEGDAENHHDLPPCLNPTGEINRCICRYATRDAALVKLNDRCVDYGREQAGQPKLVREKA